MGGSGHGEPIPDVEAAWGGASAEIGAAMEAPGTGRERERCVRERELRKGESKR